MQLWNIASWNGRWDLIKVNSNKILLLETFMKQLELQDLPEIPALFTNIILMTDRDQQNTGKKG